MSLFRGDALDKMEGFKRIAGPAGAEFTSVSTDTRTISQGSLFVPLKGERFDGHAYISDAVRGGANGVVLSDVPVELPQVATWQVTDTLVALGDLARAHRDQFSIPLLSLTGTSGKTSTKEILRQMFQQRALLVNEGNFNNLVGVPQTLFRLNGRHQFAVIEMGMNRFGEIARLTRISNPTVGMILNVGAGHLEGLGSIEGVLKAKTEIAKEMRPEAPLILNADDPLLRKFGQGAQRQIVWFGLQVGADVSARDIDDRGLQGSTFVLQAAGNEARVHLRLPGEHNVLNALGAAAAALQMGLSFAEVVDGITSTQPFRMRNEVFTGPRGSRIVSDCYNANPPSMREALKVLSNSRDGGRIGAVLGDMLELGDQSETYHRELGEWVASVKPDRVWTVGKWAPLVAQHSGKVAAEAVTDRDVLAAAVADWLQAGDTLLVKGSRGMKLEFLVEHLTGKKGDH